MEEALLALEDAEPTRAKTETSGTLSGVEAARVMRRERRVCAVACVRCVGAMLAVKWLECAVKLACG